MDLAQASEITGIPSSELENLISSPFDESVGGAILRDLRLGDASLTAGTIEDLRKEIQHDLKAVRSDGQKNIDFALILILLNLTHSVYTRTPISVPGGREHFLKGTHYNQLGLTYNATQKVISALGKYKYIKTKRGSKSSGRVSHHTPTEKLQLLLISSIYEVKEEYNPLNINNLVIFRGPEGKESSPRSPGEDIMRSRYSQPVLRPDHPDLLSLSRINAALAGCKYALKGPVKRIYSNGDPMQGGRLYTPLQNLPDRNVRIRINTRFNGEPVAEVDLSSNHPRMIQALAGKRLPDDFYAQVGSATGTTRDQVKFLLMKAIGANSRRISLHPKGRPRRRTKGAAILKSEEKAAIEAYLKLNFPDLSSSLYKGIGTHLQSLEGDILLKTMIDLLDEGIPSLPIHDAIYVQAKYAERARIQLEKAWMQVLGVSFKPTIKTEISKNQEAKVSK